MNSATSTDPGLRPWQLFLLAGMLAATGVVLVSRGQPLSGIIVLSLTVVAASLVAMGGYRSLAPLMRAAEADDVAPVTGRTRAALEREKALVLRTIKEVEFDHAMGKTAAADFEHVRDRLKLRALGLMRQLESSDYRAAVEADLAARTPAVAPVRPGDGTAPGPAPRPSASSLARVCGACQGVNDVDARFCKHCGASLAEVPA